MGLSKALLLELLLNVTKLRTVNDTQI